MANTLRLEVILSMLDKASGPLKRIMGGADGATEALRKSAAALRGLQGSSTDISDFAKTRAALRATSTQLADYTAKSGAAKSMLEAQRAAHHTLAGEVKAARVAFKHSAAAMASQKSSSAEAVAAYKTQQQSLAALETRYNLSTSALRRQKDALKIAEGRVQQLAAKHSDLSAKLDASRSKLEAAGLSTDKLGARQRELRNDIQRATMQMQQQEKALARMVKTQAMAAGMKSRGMERFGQGSSMALTGLGVTRVAAFPVAAAIEFESAMADVRKVVNFDTPQQFKRMGADIQELSTRVPMASEEIAKMVAFAGQALGQDTAKGELLRFAEDAAKMGVAFDMSAEDAGQTMATWRTAFRLAQGDAVKLADQVNYLGNTGPANAQKITAIVNRIGSLGEVAGLQSAPLAALGATIAGMGVEEEIAATGIKNLLLRLNNGASATPRQRLAFKALGLEASKVAKAMQMDAKGTIVSVLERIQKLPKDMQTASLTQLFGTESVAAIAPLLTNLDLVRENMDKVTDAERYGGSMEAEYASRKATTANNITLLKNTATVLAQRLGGLLLPQVTELATKASELITKLSLWAEKNPELAGALAKMAIVGGVLLTVFGVGLAIFGGVSVAIGNIVAVAGTLSGALGGAGIAAGSIAAPLLLIAGIGLLIWKYWEPIKAFLGGMWDGFLEGIQPIMPVLDMLADTLRDILTPADASKETLDGFASAGKAVGTVLGWVVSAVVVPLGLALKGVAIVFQWVGEFIGNTIGFIVTGLGNLWDVISGIFSGDWGQVMAGLRGNWENINQYFGGLPAKFLQYGIDIVKGLINGITSMYGAAKKAIGGLGDAVIGFFTGPKQLDIHSPSRTFARFGHFTIAGFTQGLLGGESGAQKALGRIGNGLRTTAAGIAIGTAGMATAGNAVPLDMRPAMAAGAQAGGAPTYNITINAPAGAQAQDIAALVRAEIERLEHRRATGRRAALSDYD